MYLCTISIFYAMKVTKQQTPFLIFCLFRYHKSAENVSFRPIIILRLPQINKFQIKFHLVPFVIICRLKTVGAVGVVQTDLVASVVMSHLK